MAYYYLEKPKEDLYEEVFVIHDQLKHSLNQERRLIYFAKIFDTIKEMEERKEWDLVAKYLSIARPFVKEANLEVKLPLAQKEKRNPLHAHSDFKRVKITSKPIYDGEKEFINKLKRFQGKRAGNLPEKILSAMRNHMWDCDLDADNLSPEYVSLFLKKKFKHSRFAKHSNRVYYLLTGDKQKLLYDLDPAQENVLIQNHSHEKDVRKLVERVFAK